MYELVTSRLSDSNSIQETRSTYISHAQINIYTNVRTFTGTLFFCLLIHYISYNVFVDLWN